MRIIITPFLKQKYFKTPHEAIFVSGLGFAAVEQALQKAVQMGITEVIFIGSCGAVKDFNIGDIVVPIETTSGSLRSEVLNELSKRNLPLLEASTASVKSLSEETPDYISNLINNNISLVDMEYRFLIDKAAELKIEAAGILYVTDIPLIKPFTEEKSTEEKEAIKLARTTAADIVSSLVAVRETDPLYEFLGFIPGVNKESELRRLLYEISKREKIPVSKILADQELKSAIAIKDMSRADKFAVIKERLLKRRFPSAYSAADFRAFLNPLVLASGKQRIYTELFKPERIYIESASEGSEIALRAAEMYPDIPLLHIDDVREYRKANPAKDDDPGKRDLVITRQLWDFVKRCPCTKEAVYCGYNVINLGFGCPFDCTYCYLQHYANSGGIMIDSNVSDFFPKIEAFLDEYKGRTIRIGTGEFTDSLALDHITQYSRALVPYFSDKDVLFELKTKSANIANLEGLNHNGRTVIGWSLNPQKIISTEEYGAASLFERLTAAQKCEEWGYKTAFHFDPVIHYEGWEKEYEEVVNMLFDYVKAPEWISIGTLRFHRGLKGCIEKRFPETDYIYGEMILGIDKKVRYHEVLRKEMTLKMAEWIKRRSSSVYVYPCMETPEMWRKINSPPAFQADPSLKKRGVSEKEDPPLFSREGARG